MLAEVMNWLTNQWLEVASLAIAIAALIYAALAHNAAKSAALAAKEADLSRLRLQASSSLAEAKRSFLSLKNDCQANRVSWKRYKNEHLPSLTLQQPEELKALAVLERHGAELLRGVDQSFVGVDEMGAKQLETKIAQAKKATLEIEGLSLQLAQPPNFTH